MKEAEKAIYFLDTSALVKRYHEEAGTDVVDAVFEDAEVVKLVSDLSVIEFYSAFAKKARTGAISEEDFRVTVDVLAAEVRKGVVQLAILGDEEKEEAVALIEEYGVNGGLRTLDALQLAVMNKYGPQGIDEVYCADRRFSTVIEREGYSVIDPEEHAPMEEQKGP